MKKKLIAITGGLATGKSTVLNIIKEFGFSTLSCDDVVRELYSRPDIRALVVNLCGKGILNEKDEINRKSLLLLILRNEALRKKLEKLIHPLVWKEIENYHLKEKKGPLFVEVPLLFEAGWEDRFDEIWVVTCSEETQRERILRKPDADLFLTLAETQLPLKEKIKKADRIISSEKTLDELREELKDILKEYQED